MALQSSSNLDLFRHALGPASLIDTLVNDAAVTGAGTAYLFDAGTGMLTQTFVTPSPSVSVEFGYAVAPLGSHKVVEAVRRDDTGGPNVGAVYIFDVARPILSESLSESCVDHRRT